MKPKKAADSDYFDDCAICEFHAGSRTREEAAYATWTQKGIQETRETTPPIWKNRGKLVKSAHARIHPNSN